ncbi:MAG: radical SAM protein [Candidatus Saganbacteria bacterium]|nr:radical SAM protein [Candidatus Saganbacteria bacterium]
MTLKVCHYFVTLRCNDACEFCACWSNEAYRAIEEKPYDLAPLKKAGIRLLNITGGEPLLRADLPEILARAKAFGLPTVLTTNGLLYEERARELAGLAGRLHFSLDYPSAEGHDRSRGVECFGAVLAGLKRARELGERPLIQFTLTRDSVRFLPEMVELAEKLEVPLYLNPVYDFFGTQGFEPRTLDQIKYFARRRRVLANLAALEFVRAGGNSTLLPRCRARETTLTLLPDGRRVSPCLFNPGGREGRESVCSSCMRWPYMLPSFSLGLDRYFWLNLYSELVNKRKLAGSR